MLTTDQNKRIAGELGLCWHEYVVGFKNGGKLSRCSCGMTGYSVLEICAKDNPRFDTKKGFFLIIENGPSRDWWDEFMRDLNHRMIAFRVNGSDLWAIRQDYIGPKLAVALNEFLEVREK